MRNSVSICSNCGERAIPNVVHLCGPQWVQVQSGTFTVGTTADPNYNQSEQERYNRMQAEYTQRQILAQAQYIQRQVDEFHRINNQRFFIREEPVFRRTSDWLSLAEWLRITFIDGGQTAVWRIFTFKNVPVKNRVKMLRLWILMKVLGYWIRILEIAQTDIVIFKKPTRRYSRSELAWAD